MPEAEELHDVLWLQNRILELHGLCEAAARLGTPERGSESLLQLDGIVDALSVTQNEGDSYAMLYKLAVHAKQKAMKQMKKAREG